MGDRAVAEGHEGLQAFADDIGVRELVLVRQDFPGGEEQGVAGCACCLNLQFATFNLQPRRNVLLKTFLRLEAVGDDDDRPAVRVGMCHRALLRLSSPAPCPR